MLNKIVSGIISGVIATAFMSLFMYVASSVGMPTSAPQELIEYVFGVTLISGWIFHFIIGIVLALLYIFIFRQMLTAVNSWFIKGIIFGFIAFLIAQIGFFGLEQAAYDMPNPSSDDTVLVVTGGLIGHLVFGIMVVLLLKKTKTA
ncbi:hypothetical protein MWU59_09380 [Flavobacteriaceae bacterium F08102]|nr:hypothetical protein [Flavobacteriaceae bacterium F08102]